MSGPRWRVTGHEHQIGLHCGGPDIELRFGDSMLAIADDSPDMAVISPLTLGGTYGALHLAVEDAGPSARHWTGSSL
jgi:hypothetical protein